MILKYFELNKLNLEITNFLLFHGKNEGYKNEELNKIINKFNIKVKNYDEKQVIDNTEEFFVNNLNKSLFESDKIIIINRCTDKIIKIIEELVDRNINDIIFILNSDALEKKSKLRNFFERSKKNLVSIAFYPDNFDTLLRIAQQTLREKKILLSNECINVLVSKCASDRKNLLNEIEKIELYLKDKKKINNEEVFKIINLSENHNVNELINSCLSKNQKKLFTILNDNIFSNEDCIVIIRSLLRKTKNLLNLVTQFQLNKNIDTTIDNAKPPIFWKEKNVIRDQMNIWSINKLKELIIEINEIEYQIKKNSFHSINLTTNFLLEKSA
tara:strand:- start:9800 stop:10783 length:984 start_codon:yes stop_codon:yes gene_type:complete